MCNLETAKVFALFCFGVLVLMVVMIVPVPSGPLYPNLRNKATIAKELTMPLTNNCSEYGGGCVPENKECNILCDHCCEGLKCEMESGYGIIKPEVKCVTIEEIAEHKIIKLIG